MKEEDFKKPKIFVAVPHTGNIRAELAALLIEWSHNETHPNFNVMTDISYGRPMEHNRNKLVKEFLQTDCTHMFLLDSDIVPERNCLTKLLAHSKNIIGAAAFSSQDGMIFPVIMKINKDKKTLNDGQAGYKVIKELTSLTEVDATGASSLLVKREVFERPEMKYPFKFSYDEEGLLENGEDFNFCVRIKELGYKVYVDPTTICSHLTIVDLKEINARTAEAVNSTKRKTYESLASLTNKIEGKEKLLNEEQQQELKRIKG